jgi:hypothetical protein
MMAMRGQTTCAVNGCRNPIWGPNNLCDEHRLPGGVVQVNDSTMVTTIWTAEHNDEFGYILLNDWALGDLFGGREGFEAKLAEQGFVNVRNVATPFELFELKAAMQPPQGKKVGSWSGSWLTKYPWESCDAAQFGLERALLEAIDHAARSSHLTDEGEPPFWKSGMVN